MQINTDCLQINSYYLFQSCVNLHFNYSLFYFSPPRHYSIFVQITITDVQNNSPSLFCILFFATFASKSIIT